MTRLLLINSTLITRQKQTLTSLIRMKKLPIPKVKKWKSYSKNRSQLWRGMLSASSMRCSNLLLQSMKKCTLSFQELQRNPLILKTSMCSWTWSSKSTIWGPTTTSSSKVQSWMLCELNLPLCSIGIRIMRACLMKPKKKLRNSRVGIVNSNNPSSLRRKNYTKWNLKWLSMNKNTRSSTWTNWCRKSLFIRHWRRSHANVLSNCRLICSP